MAENSDGHNYTTLYKLQWPSPHQPLTTSLIINDMLNVSNFTDGKHKRKPFCDPYHSAKDHRLKVIRCFILSVPNKLILHDYNG